MSLKIDWFNLLAVQGTFKSLLHLHSLRHNFLAALPSLWSSSHNQLSHDHWEDHGLDYTDLSQQSNVSAFQHTV